MSFSNNCKPEKMPGPMKGNPLAGLCEKACIQVNKVFDACMKQETLQNVTITLTNIQPSTLTPPYKFISGKSPTTEAYINNLMVTDLPDAHCCARISGDVEVPIQVVIIDSKGAQGVAQAIVTIPKDVILHTSAPSIMPYRIEAIATLVATDGTYLGNDQFSINACATVIMKVVMQVELLVPSYGYAYIPPCQEYTQEQCDGIFDLPLYPQECGCEPKCQ